MKRAYGVRGLNPLHWTEEKKEEKNALSGNLRGLFAFAATLALMTLKLYCKH